MQMPDHARQSAFVRHLVHRCFASIRGAIAIGKEMRRAWTIMSVAASMRTQRSIAT
ncbi:MAG: hypothetical protein V4475_15270 [Pseudomonadota bacterium]